MSDEAHFFPEISTSYLAFVEEDSVVTRHVAKSFGSWGTWLSVFHCQKFDSILGLT